MSPAGSVPKRFRPSLSQKSPPPSASPRRPSAAPRGPPATSGSRRGRPRRPRRRARRARIAAATPAATRSGGRLVSHRAVREHDESARSNRPVRRRPGQYGTAGSGLSSTRAGRAAAPIALSADERHEARATRRAEGGEANGRRDTQRELPTASASSRSPTRSTPPPASRRSWSTSRTRCSTSCRRRAGDHLRPRHQEPGALLALQGRPGGPRDPRPQELRLDRRLHRALPQDGQHRGRLRRVRARRASTRACASTRAGTRPRASGRPRSSRPRSSSTSTSWASCSSSTSAAAARFSARDEEAAEELAKILGIAFYNQHRAARTNKPSKFGALVDKGLVSEKDVEKADLGRPREPAGRGEDPDRGDARPQGGGPPRPRPVLQLRASGRPPARRSPRT